MKAPRDIKGEDLAKRLTRLGYWVERQRGSHLILTTTQQGEHHVAVPAGRLKTGTLYGILLAIARHFDRPKQEIINCLFKED